MLAGTAFARRRAASGCDASPAHSAGSRRGDRRGAGARAPPRGRQQHRHHRGHLELRRSPARAAHARDGGALGRGGRHGRLARTRGRSQAGRGGHRQYPCGSCRIERRAAPPARGVRRGRRHGGGLRRAARRRLVRRRGSARRARAAAHLARATRLGVRRRCRVAARDAQRADLRDSLVFVVGVRDLLVGGGGTHHRRILGGLRARHRLGGPQQAEGHGAAARAARGARA